MRRFLHLLALALTAVAASAAAATAAPADEPDPDAPPGAPPNWLPQEPWVMSHWLPFDHRILLRELGVDFQDLPIVIDESDEVSLGDVARDHDVSPRQLRKKLIAPWRGEVSRTKLRLLRLRAKKMFTQPHLASHMFGHIFHVGILNASADRLYGMPIGDVARLHAQGHSYYEIGEMNGRSRAELRRMVSEILRWAIRKGVREQATPRAWARFWLDYQHERLENYLSYRSGGPHHLAGASGAPPSRRAPAALNAGSRPGVGVCRLHGSRRL